MPSFPSIRRLMFAVWFLACGHLSAQMPVQAEDIRPPRELIEIPRPEEAPVGLWLGIGGTVLVLLIAALLWRRYSRMRNRKSPPEIALKSLAELERSREALTAEAFANRAAQTVRQYISDRFGLAAPRRTTEEFLRDVGKSPLVGEGDHLRAFLKSCDLAKFAGSNLDAEQRGELLRTARAFVNTTAKPQTGSP